MPSNQRQIVDQAKFTYSPLAKFTYSPEVSTEPATEPTKHKKSKLTLPQWFLNKITANEKDTNDEIFWNYFKYQNLSKDLIRATRKKEQLVMLMLMMGWLILETLLSKNKFLKMKIQT